MKYFSIAAFLVIFMTIYFSLNYYAMFRALGFFAVTRNIWLIALIITLTYPMTAFIDRYLHSLPTRILYYISNTWAGMIFFMFFIILIAEIINFAFPIFHNPVAGMIVVGIVFCITIFALVNGSLVTVKEVSIDNFGKVLKIVQITDIHIGTIRNSDFLLKIVEKVNDLNPDMIMITGDLLDGSGKPTPETFKPLEKFKAPAYFVLGNHEYYEKEGSIEKLLVNNNVVVLVNELTTTKGINIIGIDYTEKKEYVREKLAEIDYNQKKPTILLTHVPVGYEYAKKTGINLQLSGHTHDGQIFPFNLFVKIFFPKSKGLYKIGNFSLYVSPGTNTWGPPMRLGSSNEITLFHLR